MRLSSRGSRPARPLDRLTVFKVIIVPLMLLGIVSFTLGLGAGLILWSVL